MDRASDFSKLTVPVLRQELSKRGLDTSGLKAVLVARLNEAIESKEAAAGAKEAGGARILLKQSPSRAAPAGESKYLRGFLVSALLALVLAVVVPPLLFGGWEDEGECPFHPEACFFSDSYAGARALFRAKVEALGPAAAATLTTLKLKETDPSLDLAIDVALLRGEGAVPGQGPLLVHLSGVHGVEGHAGSAIQSAFLSGLQNSTAAVPAGVTVALVHAVNPFGFMFGRRWNENSVDLNRNMLPADTYGETKFEDRAKEGLAPDSDYEAITSLVNPGQATWAPVVDDLLYVFKAARAVVQYGMTRVKRALVTGQYYNSKGIWYGGTRLEESHALLLAHLRAEFPRHDPVIKIDVHTGLGPTGVDTLMVGNALRHRDWAVATFGQPDAGHDDVRKRFLIGGDSAGDASAGYDRAEGFSGNYLPAMLNQCTHTFKPVLNKGGGCGWTRAASVTQEFGTVPGVLVIWGLVKENTLWHHAADGDVASRQRGSRAARDVFYVRTASWQHSVVVRGLTLIDQAAALLAKMAGDGTRAGPAWSRFPVNDGVMKII